ncbi:DUF898 family protein [Sphingomonas sp. ASV193]|uniref:YjgN family protein n=1 Tax=Sphingomonas sp. ASV193 TaxID=3144405 RepID=UPI0032E889F0
MNSLESIAPADEARAVRFTGSWRDYLPIAATNVLLTVVTLGVYRFWASARQRRYLWSHTEVIDDTLEWTGTGREMFVGFLIVMAFLLPFFGFIQFLFPALIARGKTSAATGLLLLFEIGLLYLGGVARFRALRYRLSRSWWRGIRGGSDEPGWAYGGEYLGRMIVSWISLFTMFPWTVTRLWDARWNGMSFGQLRFTSSLTAEDLKDRWGLVYAVPILAFAFGFLIFRFTNFSPGFRRGMQAELAVTLLLLIIAVYVLVPLLTLNFFAAYYRNAAAALRLGDLEFGFDATTWQWLKLFLGNLALAVVTLGAGISYWGYRNWTFMVRHLELYGEVDVAALVQSTTHAPREAEGFADAFDLGAM